MAKIIRRIEITHEIDKESNTTCVNRKYTGFNQAEIIGVLSLERARWLERSLRDDPLPQDLKSEVKPDEPASGQS